MRIGIDLDDTISCTKEEINYLLNIFLKENQIAEEELNRDIIHQFHLKYIKDVFSNELVKDGAVDYIDKLSKNNEIYIITARNDLFFDNTLDVKKYTYNWLDKNNIKYDKVIFNSYHEGKKDACINNKIDLFIDDDIENIKWVKSSGIKTILYDDSGKYTGIECITNWNDLYNYIINYKQ